jgi:hypothetical protein
MSTQEDIEIKKARVQEEEADVIIEKDRLDILTEVASTSEVDIVPSTEGEQTQPDVEEPVVTEEKSKEEKV